MKICTNCNEHKNLTEFYTKKNSSDGFRGQCKTCMKQKDKFWYINNKEKKEISVKKWRRNNRDKIKKYNKNFYMNHPDASARYRRKWRSKNLKRDQETQRNWSRRNKNKICQYAANFRKRCPHKVIAIKAKQRAKRLKRAPQWLTKDDLRFMAIFYKEAKRLTVETGIRYEVDHIIPLQGKNVSGLHVPWNLQVITESENCSKKNKYEIKT